MVAPSNWHCSQGTDRIFHLLASFNCKEGWGFINVSNVHITVSKPSIYNELLRSRPNKSALFYTCHTNQQAATQFKKKKYLPRDVVMEKRRLERNWSNVCEVIKDLSMLTQKGHRNRKTEARAQSVLFLWSNKQKGISILPQGERCNRKRDWSSVGVGNLKS